MLVRATENQLTQCCDDSTALSAHCLLSIGMYPISTNHSQHSLQPPSARTLRRRDEDDYVNAHLHILRDALQISEGTFLLLMLFNPFLWWEVNEPGSQKVKVRCFILPHSPSVQSWQCKAVLTAWQQWKQIIRKVLQIWHTMCCWILTPLSQALLGNNL